MNLNQWTKGLRLRLLIVSIVPAVALSVVAYFGITTAKKLDSELYKASEIRGKLIEYTGDMEAAAHASVRMLWTSIGVEDLKEEAAAIKKTRDFVADFDEARAHYLQIPRSEKMIEMFKTVEENWPIAKTEIESALKVLEAHAPHAKEASTQAILNKIRPAMNAVTTRINEMQDVRREIMQKEIAETQKDTQFAIWLLSVISVVSGLGALALGLTVAARTAAAILKVTEILNESSEHVSSAAAQIAASSQELSQAITEQSAALEQTAASLEEMSSMVGKNNDNARNTAQTSTQSERKAGEGKSAVERMMGSMGEINDSNDLIIGQVNHSNQQMSDIVKLIQEIGNKTKVINDIVFQTKLLSFNASVEAARAGEHGKGFAVVAEEVGNLAQMSGNAAKEISEMLEGSISRVTGIVHETRSKVESLTVEGKKKVEFGVEVAKQCGDVLNEIVTNVSSVSSMAVEISSASQEQSQGISEINKAMAQLEQVTQQNSIATQETASAAEELSAQAESLKNAVGDLLQVIEGSQGRTPAHSFRVPKQKAKVHTKKPEIKLVRGETDMPDRTHSGFEEVS